MSQSLSENQTGSDPTLKAFSCLACRLRKVRCDRQTPCSNCIKAEAPCSFVPPVRGKRKRIKPAREGLHAKVKRYEDMLRAYGAKIEPSSESDESDAELTAVPSHKTNKSDNREQQPAVPNNASELDVARPKLVTRGGFSRYFDSVLWGNLGDDFHHPDEYTTVEAVDGPENHENDLFLDPLAHFSHELNDSVRSLANFHPSQQVLLKLRDIFVDRVDPLLKILHVPTFWSSLMSALQYPHEIPKSLEAAIFCFYLATINSLEDSECQSVLGGQKSVLLPRYRMVARYSLSNAEYLRTSSPMTLCAFLLFLMGIKDNLRHDTQYILTGIAVRLARKMGLHRDGESLGLTPFDTEMRRRLWWQIVHIDFRTADQLGTRPSLDLFSGDAKTPLNVADEDLAPDMTVFPKERNGITSIVPCLIRCEIMTALRKLSQPFSTDARWDVLSRSDITVSKIDTAILELEDILERKFLRYCDPFESLHTFVSIMIRAGLCRMRLLAHNPRRFAERGAAIPQAERDIVFVNVTKMLEYAALVQENQAIHKYMWQISTTYLWNLILYALIEARHRKTGPEVNRLWQLIGIVFSQYPNAFKAGTVFAALGKWMLEVWNEYVAAAKAARLPEPIAPEYINAIRQGKASNTTRAALKFKTPSEIPASLSANSVGHEKPQLWRQDVGLSMEFDSFDSYVIPDLVSFETNTSEWVQWEQLVFEQGGLGQVGEL